MKVDWVDILSQGPSFFPHVSKNTVGTMGLKQTIGGGSIEPHLKIPQASYC